MNMPGFTAETAVRNRGERYQRQQENAVASENGARIVPARRIGPVQHGDLRYFCGKNGVYWSQGPTTSTYGCYRRDGSGGIVCGGQTQEEKGSCDTF